MSGAEIAALGPVIGASTGVATRAYDAYIAETQETGNAGKKKKSSQCKRLFCCCLSFLKRNSEHAANSTAENSGATGNESRQKTEQTISGGDDEDGIHYSSGMQVKPVFVCCGGVYESRDIDEGAYISDRHEAVNNSQRFQRNGQSNPGQCLTLKRTKSAPGGRRAEF